MINQISDILANRKFYLIPFHLYHAIGRGKVFVNQVIGLEGRLAGSIGRVCDSWSQGPKLKIYTRRRTNLKKEKSYTAIDLDP